MTSLLSLFLLMSMMHIIFSKWISIDHTLPKADQNMAVGAYNDSIFILGGDTYRKQLTEWNSNTKTFIYYGDDYLSVNSKCSGQYWTQKHEFLYFIRDDIAAIAIFNMKTKQVTAEWVSNSHKNFDYTGCMASSDDYLFVCGGGGTLDAKGKNNLYILDFNTEEWLTNPPSMNSARFWCASVVYNGYLWAFSGANTPGKQTDERIVLENIMQNAWDYVDPLSTVPEVPRPRAVAFRGYIYIVTQTDILHIMDADTGAITVAMDKLPHAPLMPAMLLFDDGINILGGSNTNLWIYYPLTTSDPTSDPTSAPTSDPSSAPTSDPSSDPTSAPTSDPTSDPTSGSHLTLYPSRNPAVEPIIIPIIEPTTSPTEYQTMTTFNITPTDTTTLFGEGQVLPITSSVEKQIDSDVSAHKEHKWNILLIILIFMICFVLIMIIILMVLFIKWWIIKHRIIKHRTADDTKQTEQEIQQRPLHVFMQKQQNVIGSDANINQEALSHDSDDDIMEDLETIGNVQGSDANMSHDNDDDIMDDLVTMGNDAYVVDDGMRGNIGYYDEGEMIHDKTNDGETKQKMKLHQVELAKCGRRNSPM